MMAWFSRDANGSRRSKTRLTKPHSEDFARDRRAGFLGAVVRVAVGALMGIERRSSPDLVSERSSSPARSPGSALTRLRHCMVSHDAQGGRLMGSYLGRADMVAVWLAGHLGPSGAILKAAV